MGNAEMEPMIQLRLRHRAEPNFPFPRPGGVGTIAAAFTGLMGVIFNLSRKIS